jgi:quinolinate synthase
MLTQQALPEQYRQLDDERLDALIRRRREELGRRVCILGHHYQRDEVVRHADFTGDSLKLSRQAAEQTDAEFIVFCGVHFMAESADVLSAERQQVLLPNLEAGCAMADMADLPAIGEALDELAGMTDARIVPVTYVNSAAAIKAVTGRAGGACCTSSNARRVFEWALTPEADGGAGGGKVFAIPDQHLGRNTAVAMGYAPDDCVVYEPNKVNGGLTPEDVERATFILWRGYCYVHQLFTPEHVRKVRERHDGIAVIVHPECTHEVVQLADAAGSTEQIIRALDAAEAGSKWAVGTESNLVNRLARRHKDKFVRVLSDAPASCFQMARIDLPHLAWVLDNLAEGNVVNPVAVPPEQAADARTALERMISI